MITRRVGRRGYHEAAGTRRDPLARPVAEHPRRWRVAKAPTDAEPVSTRSGQRHAAMHRIDLAAEHLAISPFVDGLAPSSAPGFLLYPGAEGVTVDDTRNRLQELKK